MKKKQDVVCTRPGLLPDLSRLAIKAAAAVVTGTVTAAAPVQRPALSGQRPGVEGEGGGAGTGKR